MIELKKARSRKRGPIDQENVGEELDRLLQDGILLDKDLKGEIIRVVLAPNESKVISHGLRTIPQFRLILRQSHDIAGNVTISDVNEHWTERTVGFLNNSGTVTVTLLIKLFPG